MPVYSIVIESYHPPKGSLGLAALEGGAIDWF